MICENAKLLEMTIEDVGGRERDVMESARAAARAIGRRAGRELSVLDLLTPEELVVWLVQGAFQSLNKENNS